MAPRKKSTIKKNSSKKREMKVKTRKKHIENLRVLSRKLPVRFASRKESVLRIQESNSKNSSPSEINLRLRGCRHGTPFRQISPIDGETDQTETYDNGNEKNMLNKIAELLTRPQVQNSLSRIVHMALDHGIQNRIIINGGGPRHGNSQWSNASSKSLISVSSEGAKDSSATNVATVSAWGGRSFFRVGEVIGKLLTYLKPPIPLTIKKSTVSEDASTQCYPCDISISQLELNAVNDIYKKNESTLTTYNGDWNTCSEKCSTHISLDTNAANSSMCSDNILYLNSSCSSANQLPGNVNIKTDYVRANQSPVMSNNHPIVPNQRFNTKIPSMMDLFNYEQCLNTGKEEEGM